MHFLEQLRKLIFWTVEAIKGGEVKKHYNEIKRSYFDKDQVISRQIQQNNLNNILKHAVSNIPYYSTMESLDLESFPVVNKSTIKANYAAFITKGHTESSLKFVTTSGSTGTPFRSYRDNIKINRHKADTIFFNELAGLVLGERLYYFRIWNKLINKRKLLQKFQNVVVIDSSSFTEAKVSAILSRIKNDKSNKSMLAYASAYEAFLESLNGDFTLNLAGQLKTIITMSETMPDGVKTILKELFNCPVVSRYSNMENGFIAQQCIEENNEYHINRASYLVEILQLEEDIPAREGEPGRIVVTDLFNYGMAMIRYDTGDIGIMHSSARCNNSSYVLTDILGRKVDFIYSTKDQLISPHVVTNTMWKYSNVQQFQFVQKTANNYLMILNSSEELENLEKNISTDLLSFLGDDAQINFEYVNEIPLLSSGKRKKVVNEYKQ